MNVVFTPRAWFEYTGWQLQDKKTLKRINLLIKDIERNGNTGIGKPELLQNLDGCWSRRIDQANRLVYKLVGEGEARDVGVVHPGFAQVLGGGAEYEVGAR